MNGVYHKLDRAAQNKNIQWIISFFYLDGFYWIRSYCFCMLYVFFQLTATLSLIWLSGHSVAKHLNVQFIFVWSWNWQKICLVLFFTYRQSRTEKRNGIYNRYFVFFFLSTCFCVLFLIMASLQKKTHNNNQFIG